MKRLATLFCVAVLAGSFGATPAGAGAPIVPHVNAPAGTSLVEIRDRRRGANHQKRIYGDWGNVQGSGLIRNNRSRGSAVGGHSYRRVERDYRRGGREVRRGDRHYRRGDRDYRRGDRDYRRGDRHYRRGDRDYRRYKSARRHYRPHRRYYDDYDFFGPTAGFITGVIIGSGISGGYGGAYYDFGRPAYRDRYYVISDAHVRWCDSRYRSYRAWDDTFQPYDGPRRRCNSPYDGR